MSSGRLPAHLEVSGLIRSIDAAGGFATVVARGDRDSGSILIVTREKGRRQRVWERMPRLDGSRRFEVVREQVGECGADFADYLRRRTASDSDTWLIEVDIANPERFIVTDQQ